jgi:hypothetical protein
VILAKADQAAAEADEGYYAHGRGYRAQTGALISGPQ